MFRKLSDYLLICLIGLTSWAIALSTSWAIIIVLRDWW
jgi:hypothetical protein